MASAFQKVNAFVADLGNGVHNFNSHNFYILLTNTAVTASTAVKADVTECTGTGYTAGGNACTLSSFGQSGGIATLKLNDPTMWTAGAGGISAFQYAVLYNNSATNKNIVGYWDYGSPVTLASGETFTVDLDGSNGVLTIQ